MYFFSSYPPWIFEASALIVLECTEQIKMAGRQVKLSLPPRWWDYKHAPYQVVILFCFVLFYVGIEIPHACAEALYWVHTPLTSVCQASYSCWCTIFILWTVFHWILLCMLGMHGTYFGDEVCYIVMVGLVFAMLSILAMNLKLFLAF